MRVLVTGWPSFLDGEATAGDVLSMAVVADRLRRRGIEADLAYSPVFRHGALSLADAEPDRYTHLVFACGPVHGRQIVRLHERYAGCRRIAVGVSVIDPADAAVTGFHRVLARDGAGPPAPDLAAAAATRSTPVVGVVLAPGQPEYRRRRHDEVARRLTGWVNAQDCAPVELDTRLDSRDWRHCATGAQFTSLLRRLDLVVTSRLHGMVLAVRQGVPALAADPVGGGGKVTAQAAVLGWPARLAADDLTDGALRYWWQWCLSGRGRQRAAALAAAPADERQLTALLDDITAGTPRRSTVPHDDRARTGSTTPVRPGG